jgi:hypothetical protein
VYKESFEKPRALSWMSKFVFELRSASTVNLQFRTDAERGQLLHLACANDPQVFLACDFAREQTAM